MSGFDPLVDEAVEKLGLGFQQVLVLAPGGFAYAFTTAMSLIVSISAHQLIEKDLSSTYAAMMMSFLFAGYTAGNLVGGFLADSQGRRWPLVLEFACLAMLQGLIVFIGGHGFWLPACAVVGIGFFMGVGLAAANAGMKEWTPAGWRATLFGMLFVFLALGQICTVGLVWILAPALNLSTWQWKFLFTLNAGIAVVICVFSVALLPESSHWLNGKGRMKDASERLRSAAWWNGTGSQHLEHLLQKLEQEPNIEEPGRNSATEVTPLKASQEKGIFEIFSGRLGIATVILCWVNVMANGAYYGLIYTLPKTITDLFTQAHFTPAALMFIAALCELPGIVLQIYVGSQLSRHVNLALMFGALSVMAALLGFGLSWVSWAATLGALGMKLFAIACFIITYIVLAEVYPTSCRGSGIGFCMTVGRFGAVCAPLLYDFLGSLSGNDSAFYFTIAAGSMIAAVSSCFLPSSS